MMTAFVQEAPDAPSKQRGNSLASNLITPLFSARMDDKTFKRLSSFIEERIGVKIPPSKKALLEGRLRKRLLFWGFCSYKEYCSFLFSPEGMKRELPEMLHAVTTHKTDFFREPNHFRYLVDEALPRLLAGGMVSPLERLLVWSAGCSTGEEAYTLAMVLHHAMISRRAPMPFIFASDISNRVIEEGRAGIYPEESLQSVPLEYRCRYFLRSKQRDKKLVRIVPELRSLVSFRQMNILEDRLQMDRPFHIIFCRNVIIYFDKRTQEYVINKLASYLVGGGYLFLGHSETIHGIDAPLYSVAPAVYRKRK